MGILFDSRRRFTALAAATATWTDAELRAATWSAHVLLAVGVAAVLVIAETGSRLYPDATRPGGAAVIAVLLAAVIATVLLLRRATTFRVLTQARARRDAPVGE